MSNPLQVGATTMGVTASGTLSAAGDSVVIDCLGQTCVAWQIANSMGAGTVKWGISNDGTTWTDGVYVLAIGDQATLTFIDSGSVSPNLYFQQVPSCRYARMIAEAGFTGSVTVSARATDLAMEAQLWTWGGPTAAILNGYAYPTVRAALYGLDANYNTAYPINIPDDASADGDSLGPLSHLKTHAQARVMGSGKLGYGLRTPDTFKTASATASGNTALWTPAGGKKFRLMRYMLTVTDNATQTTPGTLTISLFDAAAGDTGQAHSVFVPSVALVNTGSLYSSGWIDLGNGRLSSAADAVLNINLSAALTAGAVRVICCGTEEA